jgi:hypothetical protein
MEEFDTSSITTEIADNISEVNAVLDVVDCYGGSPYNNCGDIDIKSHSATTTPSYNYMFNGGSGTVYVNDEVITGLGTYTFDLGSQGVTDLKNDLSNNVFRIFSTHGNFPTKVSSGGLGITSGSSISLEIVYSIPTVPQPPTGLTTVTGVPVELDWTAPTDTGDSPITGYKVFRTLNEYAYSELPDNSANSAGIDFTNNEFLTHNKHINIRR